MRAAASIAALFLVRMLGLFAILPVLPLFADDVPGSTPLLVGIALGIYGLSQAALQIPMGLLSDRFGRKLIVALGLLVFIVGSIVASWAEDIYGIILGRLLQGCGAIASTLFALVSDLTRVEQRSKAMAIIGIGIAGSFALSLVIGPLLASYFGYASVFVFSAVTGCVGLLLVWAVIPSTSVMRTNLNTAVVAEKFREILFHPSLVAVNLGVMILHYLLMSGFLVFPLLLQQVGVDPASHSGHYLGVLLASAVVMAPFVWLSDRQGQSKIVMLLMILCMTGSLVGLGANERYLIVMASMVLFFTGFNMLEVLLPAHVSRVVAAGSRGTGMGVYSTCQYTGTFLGGLVGGLILANGDLADVMYVNGAVCLCWFLLTLGMQNLSNIESRTLKLGSAIGRPAHELLDALSSVNGVLDVVLIEEDGVAYLKVDGTRFDDNDLGRFAEQ